MQDKLGLEHACVNALKIIQTSWLKNSDPIWQEEEKLQSGNIN